MFKNQNNNVRTLYKTMYLFKSYKELEFSLDKVSAV